MPDELKQGVKSSFGWIELANYESNPGDTNSGRAGIAVVSSKVKTYNGAEWGILGRWAEVSLAGGNANAISFAWQNPESSKIIVDRVVLRVTTAGGSGATMDIGVVASATDTADNLIDGVSIASAGIADNINDAGTNGKARQVVDEKGGTNDYITGKILNANSPNLAGKVYIHYILV